MSSNPFFRFNVSDLEAQKIESLAASGVAKTAKLQGIRYIPQETSVNSRLADIFKSAVVREGGIQSDIGGELQNLLGFESNTTMEDGFSNPLNADKFVGLDPGVRAAGQQLQTDVLTDIAEGNYLNLLKSIPKAAPFTAADSGGSLVAGLAGAIATATGAAALGPQAVVPAFFGNLGLRGKKVLDTAKGVKDEYNTIKKALEIGKGVGKTAAQSSFLTAGNVERQVQEYREANNGKSPSAERLASMAVGALITDTIQVGLFKKFFVPGSKELDEVKSLVRTMKRDQSSVRSIASRFGEGLKTVTVAGGAEAGQEYLQTWQQILSQNVDPQTGESLFDAVVREIQNPENQLEATGGAALGLGAGGFTKGVTAAPLTATGVAADATVGAVKSTVGAARDATGGLLNRSAKKSLSDQEKSELGAQFDNEKELVRLGKEDLKRQAGIVKKARSLDDLNTDPKVAEAAAKIQKKLDISNESLQNKATFNEFKKSLIQSNEQAQKTLVTALSSSNLASFRKSKSRPDSTPLESATAEQTEALVATISPKDKKSLRAAKELQSTLAIGMVDLINKDPKTVSQEALTQAKQLSVHDLRRVAALVSKSSPETAKELKGIADDKASALARFTPTKTKFFDTSDPDEEIARIAKEGFSNELQVRSVSKLISSAMGRPLKNTEVIDNLQTIINQYRKTEEFKKQGKGIIQAGTLDRWEKQLKARAERIADRSVKDKVKDKTKDVGKAVKNKVKSKVGEVLGVKDKPAPETKVEVKAEETVDTPAPKAPPEVSEKLDKVIKLFIKSTTEGVKEKDDISDLLKLVPGIASKLKKAGYTTNADFVSLLEQYPELESNPEVLNLFELEMYNPDEIPEIVVERTLSDEEIKEAYAQQFPGCKA